jgi:hypothetical protein
MRAAEEQGYPRLACLLKPRRWRAPLAWASAPACNHVVIAIYMSG